MAAIDLASDQCVWWNGPFPASVSENHAVQPLLAQMRLHPEKRVLADGAFTCFPECITPFNKAQSQGNRVRRQHNRAVSSRRWKVEAMFGRMKRFFHVIGGTWGRHTPASHGRWWHVIVGIYNVDVLYRPLRRILDWDEGCDEDSSGYDADGDEGGPIDCDGDGGSPIDCDAAEDAPIDCDADSSDGV